MDTYELKEYLEERGVPQSDFSIGKILENTQVLLCENQKWVVFFYEHGNRIGTEVFKNEDSACRNFIEQLAVDKYRPSKP